MAAELFNGPGQGSFLPGHPMAGKESGGAALADAELFRGATWLFTPVGPATAPQTIWRAWVERMGAVRQLLQDHGEAGVRLAAHDDGVSGQGVTPYVLSYLHRESGGRTQSANKALIAQNSRLAGEIAVSS